MTVSGPILTLNFYSNPFDVLVAFDKTVYVNWNHYQVMMGASFEIAPHLITLDKDGEPYINLTYLTYNLNQLVTAEEPHFAALAKNEFFGYVMKELAVIRDILPLIKLDPEVWNTGLFEHNDGAYFIEAAVKNLTQSCEVIIPHDTPRIPVVITINPLDLPLQFGMSRERVNAIFPVWAIDVQYLAYVLSHNRRADRDPFLHSGKINSMSDILRIPAEKADAPVKLQDMVYSVLGPELHP